MLSDGIFFSPNDKNMNTLHKAYLYTILKGLDTSLKKGFTKLGYG